MVASRQQAVDTKEIYRIWEFKCELEQVSALQHSGGFILIPSYLECNDLVPLSKFQPKYCKILYQPNWSQQCWADEDLSVIYKSSIHIVLNIIITGTCLHIIRN